MLHKPVSPPSDGFLSVQAAFRFFKKWIYTEQETAAQACFCSSEFPQGGSPGNEYYFLFSGVTFFILKLILIAMNDYPINKEETVLSASDFVSYFARKTRNES